MISRNDGNASKTNDETLKRHGIIENIACIFGARVFVGCVVALDHVCVCVSSGGQSMKATHALMKTSLTCSCSMWISVGCYCFLWEYLFVELWVVDSIVITRYCSNGKLMAISMVLLNMFVVQRFDGGVILLLNKDMSWSIYIHTTPPLPPRFQNLIIF